MTKMQFEVFVTLWQNGGWMTRNEMHAKIGHPKGWAKAIGTSTKGRSKPDTLEARGFVETEYSGNGGNELMHRLTPKGRAVIKDW